MNLLGLDETRLEAVLRERSLVAEEELQRGLAARAASPHERLSEKLLRVGVIDEDGLLEALAVQSGLPFAKLEPGLGDPAAAELVDKEWAKLHGVLPLYRVHGELTCAVADPTDLFTLDALRRLTGLDLRLVVMHPRDIAQGLSRSSEAMASMLVDEIIRDVSGQVGDDELEVVEAGVEETDLAQQAGANPVVRFVNVIILKAIRDKASDIHIEPDDHVLRVRFRIDGMLRQDDKINPPLGLAPAIVSRIKIMAGLDIAERRMPQDGRMRVNTGTQSIDLRVSVLPIYTGEKVVIRILDKSSMKGDISGLALSPRIIAGLSGQIRAPNGVILVTGPTGSGKTTTLYAALASINDVESNICTVEDPTEYSLPMINQVQVNTRAGLTFATALRALLRQDPDVIMVGEIRDKETARIAIEAALTGHLVLSTLHTNDAVAAIPRLVNMGVESYLLAAAMNAVLAQRLVRRVCAHCRVQVDPSEREIALFGRYEIPITQLARGTGCKNCGGTGYSGRVGVHELFTIDDDLRDQINRDPSLGALRQMAHRKGHLGLSHDGLAKAAEGVTTVDEVARVVELER